ncbi:MAG: hypothetical protein J5623_05310 [Clostridiales bacterium]|nr:hypothetical protein [Clostridiales bacterium]
MNTAAVITASCFTLFSVVMLICLIFSKKPLFSGRLKNYFRAVAGVYVSGTVLILFLSVALKGVPMVFILISELLILTVFVATFILTVRLSKILSENASKMAKEPVKEEGADE